MTLLDFCQLLQDSPFGTTLRESRYMWLIVESVHVLGLAISVGILLFADLRLIRGFMLREPVKEVLQPLRPWIVGGFVLMFLSGGLLFWSEAAKLYANPWFRWKLIFLLLAGTNALLFEWKLGRRVAVWGGSPGSPLGAKIAGWTSLVCWVAVIVFGRWIAYAPDE